MRATLLLLCLLLLSSPAAAQEYLGVGETVFGELTEDDPTLDDGEHYDVWLFPAAEGATYLITLRSDDFDAYLLAGPPDGTDCDPCEEDDDGALGTDAQMSLAARTTEAYVIRVTSYEPGETGQYTLQVQEIVSPAGDTLGVAAVEDMPPVVVPTSDTVVAVPEPRYLFPGAEVAEWLNEQDEVAADGAYEDTWVIEAIGGEPVTIAMRSDDFDTVLRVGRRVGGRWQELAYDDDGGDGTNSQVIFTAPRDDEYLVLASSFDPGEEGAYTILRSSPFGGDSVLVEPLALRLDQEARGRLEEGDAVEGDGAWVDVWEYAGYANATLTFRMASEDFDTFLRVRVMRDDGSWEDLGTDDDGGPGTDSELTLTLTRDATYAIHAAALEPGAGGDYSIIVRATDRRP